MGLVWVLEAVLLGCLLVYRWTDLARLQPSWAGWLLVFGAGVISGIGLTSCLFFVVGVLVGSHAAALVLEIGLLFWCAYNALRHRPKMDPQSAAVRSPVGLGWLAGALVLVLVVATAAMAVAWNQNPQGNWDAWAIWNLRANFLASPGGLAARAWSPVLAATSHPSYPLLVSSFIARCWVFGNSQLAAIPEALAYIFFVALAALVAGGLTILRGPSLGLLGALLTIATPSLCREVPTQYADVPLACYFAAALVFLLLERAQLAGIFAAFAAWTKDEGLLILVVVMVAIAVFRRKSILPAAIGALPVVILVVSFKLLSGGGAAPQLATNAGAAAHQLGDVTRMGTIVAAFAREFVAMGVGWYHPVLPLLLLVFVLGFDRDRRHDVVFCASIAVVLLLVFFGVYMATANDLNWILQTSLNRVLLQIWPALVLAVFIALRRPEAAAIITRMSQSSVRRKARA